MTPFDPFSYWAAEIVSGILSFLSASIPFIAGASASIAGAYAGYLFETARRQDGILIEDICRPMMNEVENVKDGSDIQQSKWGNIDSVSKRLLDEQLRDRIQSYTEQIEDHEELSQEISYFEVQVSRQYRADGGGIISVDESNRLTIKTGIFGDDMNPQYRETPFSEFLMELPNVSTYIQPGPNPYRNIRDDILGWAGSDECPYENLSKVWNSANRSWPQELRNLFRPTPVAEYQNNLKKREDLEKELSASASKIYDDLGRIVDGHFNRPAFSCIIRRGKEEQSETQQ